ncbi:hypothetical protein [Mesorhizobium sp. M0619]|uniref:hypothetical protein n=1 Tax=unclassified Mesorhizobium TaxID=325217 RepID=UPI0033383B9E
MQTDAKAALLDLILGRDRRLDEDDQLALATWAAMFTMVYEHADRATIAIPAEFRKQFSVDQKLSANWRIFIGTYQGLQWHGNAAHRGMALSSLSGENQGMNVQSTAFALGSLFFLVWTSFSPDLNLSDISVPTDCLVEQIWPIRSDGTIRPAGILFDSQFERNFRLLSELLGWNPPMFIL